MMIENEALIQQAADFLPASRGVTALKKEAAVTSEEHEAMQAIGGDFASTYGEITWDGFINLANHMRRPPAPAAMVFGGYARATRSMRMRPMRAEQKYQRREQQCAAVSPPGTTVVPW